MPKPKRALSPTWNLAYCHPNLLAEWDYDANAPLRPEQVTPGSAKDVTWICTKNPAHRWPASPYERVAGHGCAICAGKLAGPDNCVAAHAPQLVEEWHPTKNGEHTPWNVTYGSRRRILWRCERGHEWPATPNNRTTHNSGCPDCKPGTSRIEIRVAAEMMTLFPEEADWRRKVDGRECDVLLLPFGIAIEIDGWIWHRDRVDQDRTKTAALAEAGVRLLRLRDGRLPVLDARDVTFRPEEPHEDVMRRLAIALAEMVDEPRGAVLRAYAEGGVLVGEALNAEMTDALPGPPPGRSFADVAPEVAAEWDNDANGSLSPTDFHPYSSYPAHWCCRTCGHRWRVSIGSRTTGNGCGACNGRVATPDRNMAVVYPHLLDEWDWEANGDLRPEHVTPKSGRLVWWRCANGHCWQATPGNRANGTGCDACLRESRISLAVAFPELAAQWHPTLNGEMSPETISYGSKFEAHWQCPVSAMHVWSALVNTRTASGRPGKCPFCTGKRVAPDTSLAFLMPDLAAQWDHEANAPLGPEDVVVGSQKKFGWRCANGHTWKATVASRSHGWRQGLGGCRQCLDPLADVPIESLPRSYSEARETGAPYYYTGEPCGRGHVAPRRTSNKNCRECSRERSADYSMRRRRR